MTLPVQTAVTCARGSGVGVAREPRVQESAVSQEPASPVDDAVALSDVEIAARNSSGRHCVSGPPTGMGARPPLATARTVLSSRSTDTPFHHSSQLSLGRE